MNFSLEDVRSWRDWRPWRSFGVWRWPWWRAWLQQTFGLKREWWYNIHFTLEHFHPISGTEGWLWCDQFDRTSRLCLAHDHRPSICRDFPWYGREPRGTRTEWNGEHVIGLISRRCSFWADVPASERPADVSFAV